MNQSKPVRAGQVEYLGRWVDREHFRAFVYSADEQRLAKSYEDFTNLIATGVWFVEPVSKVANSTPLQEVLCAAIAEKVESNLVASTVSDAVDEVKNKREASKNKFKAGGLRK